MLSKPTPNILVELLQALLQRSSDFEVHPMACGSNPATDPLAESTHPAYTLGMGAAVLVQDLLGTSPPPSGTALVVEN